MYFTSHHAHFSSALGQLSNPIILWSSFTTVPTRPSLCLFHFLSLSSCLNQLVSCAHTQAHTCVLCIHAHEIHMHILPHKQVHTLAHVERGFQDLPALSYKYAQRISNQDNVDQPGFSGNVWQNEFRFLSQSDTVYSWFKHASQPSGQPRQIDRSYKVFKQVYICILHITKFQ